MREKDRKYHHYPTSQGPAGKRKVNFRLGFLFLLIFSCFVAVGVKLVILQIVKHDEYAEKRRQNAENRYQVPARRGAILDRRGRVLAKDVLFYSVGVSVNRLKNRPAALNVLSSSLNIPLSVVESKLRKNAKFVYLAQKVLPSRVEKIKALRDPGIVLERGFNRVYPYKFNAAQVLGFCGTENQPLGGIESRYNDFLQGKPGWMMLQKDAFGYQLPDLDYPGEESIDGLNVTISLDIDYQMILDDELKQSVERYNAQDGIAILMDPRSGEIIALSNYPFFDPELPAQYPAASLKNRAISDVFEPGSTFKIVTLATALEYLNLNLDRDIIFCENGSYPKYAHTFRDYTKYGWLTARRVFENSSNIGVVKIAEKLKKEVLYKNIRNFGFGMPTGIDLPGESAGLLSSVDKFSKTTHLFLSFGYEVGVTPLQLICAYAAIANEGNLMKPYFLRSISSFDGKRQLENHGEIIRRVISKETAEIMTGVLEGVIERGTGKEAHLENLSIAGKTGTAQLYDMEKATHSSRKHLASFVGYFPSQDPRFVLLVMVRDPKGSYYGGVVAAPAFREISRRIMSIGSLESGNVATLAPHSTDDQEPVIPNLENLDKNVALKILKDLNLSVSVQGNGSEVIRQEEVRRNGRLTGIILYVRDESHISENVMPSLTGLSLKQALDMLSRIDITPDYDGHGIVISQQPKAGSLIQNNKKVKLTLKPS
jgi:cell division protein FtsI/penicillin-binding protein 2